MPLFLLLLGLGLEAPAVEFLQPRARVVLLRIEGPTTVPVQVRLARHPDNRQITIAWDGDCDPGSSSKTLNGEAEPAVYPIRPLMVRVYPGRCAFMAVVLGRHGERGRAQTEVQVCGGGGAPCDAALKAADEGRPPRTPGFSPIGPW